MLFLPLVARWEVYRMPQPREAATTLSASGGQRQPKRLNVNANNRSERAEQEKYQSEIRCKKSEKLYLKLKSGEADSREWRRNLITNVYVSGF